MSDALPPGPFGCVVADPAWTFATRSRKGLDGRPQHYARMTLAQIKALPVASVAAPDCHLFLWTTGPHMRQAFDVMDAWGFKFSTMAFTWVKLNPREAAALFMTDASFFMGQGYTTRKNSEWVLLGRRGKPQRHARNVRELIIAQRREHSRKPDQFFERVERYVGDVPKLELFSRTDRPGWEAWGDQAGKWRAAA